MKFVSVHSSGESLFEKAYKVIDDNFPLVEKRTSHEHYAVFDKYSNFNMEVLVDEKEFNVLGIIGWWKFSGCLFCEHLAVDKNNHGKGLGKELLKRIQTISRETALPVILEIELPESSKEACDRLKFYEKSNFVLNGHVKHFQPPYHRDSHPMEMNIMSWPKYITNADYSIFNKEQKDIMPRFK